MTFGTAGIESAALVIHTVTRSALICSGSGTGFTCCLLVAHVARPPSAADTRASCTGAMTFGTAGIESAALVIHTVIGHALGRHSAQFACCHLIRYRAVAPMSAANLHGTVAPRPAVIADAVAVVQLRTVSAAQLGN